METQLSSLPWTKKNTCYKQTVLLNCIKREIILFLLFAIHDPHERFTLMLKQQSLVLWEQNKSAITVNEMLCFKTNVLSKWKWIPSRQMQLYMSTEIKNTFKEWECRETSCAIHLVNTKIRYGPAGTLKSKQCNSAINQTIALEWVKWSFSWFIHTSLLPPHAATLFAWGSLQITLIGIAGAKCDVFGHGRGVRFL